VCRRCIERECGASAGARPAPVSPCRSHPSAQREDAVLAHLATTFKLDSLSYGPTPGGWFYSSFAFSAPEHGGTHLDAPIHFGEGHLTVDRVPLERLIAPAVVIDVTAKTKGDQDYRLTSDDVLAFERANGKIAPGTIVLLRTGWSSRWPDKKTYLGDDTPNDATKLHFPSYGVEAARLLIQERRVAAIGVDVASIDYGPSTDFMVHRIRGRGRCPGDREPDEPQPAAADGRAAVRAADEDRRGIRWAGPGRRIDSEALDFARPGRNQRALREYTN
jgi:kynurenine formamidase